MRKTILLVDDQADVRRILERMLGALGYVVMTAASGHDALALATARTEAVDVLLTDLEMPGMDGRELARAFQAQYPGVAVLFLSGELADERDGRDADADQFLMKPCTMNELSASLARLLDGLPRS